MPRTISDQEYELNQQARGIADLALGLINDPVLGHEAKTLLKKKHPQYRDAEFDLRNEFNAKLEEDRQKRAEAEQKKLEETERERIQQMRKATQEQYGFTDEAMEKLEKFMEEKYVGDYEVAAAYMAAREPKPSDGGMDQQNWNFMKQPDIEKVQEDPEGWGSSELLAAIRRDQQRIRNGGR